MCGWPTIRIPTTGALAVTRSSKLTKSPPAKAGCCHDTGVHGNVPERDKQAREHDTELLADVLAVHSHQVDLGCLKGIPRAHRSSTYAAKTRTRVFLLALAEHPRMKGYMSHERGKNAREPSPPPPPRSRLLYPHTHIICGPTPRILPSYQQPVHIPPIGEDPLPPTIARKSQTSHPQRASTAPTQWRVTHATRQGPHSLTPTRMRPMRGSMAASHAPSSTLSSDPSKCSSMLEI